MLIRFAVQNFLSFKENTEINMSAGKTSHHGDHTAVINEKKVLKSSFIFGANASGKSNFVHAISFAKSIVLEGFSHIMMDKKYFRMDPSCKDMPGVFQFDIFAGGSFYSYGLAISYAHMSIVEEWLYQSEDTEKCIFLRSRAEDGSVDFYTDMHIPSTPQAKRFSVYAEDIKNAKMDQILFLSDVLLRSPDDDIYQPFRDVMEWFEKLTVVFPDSKYGAMTKFMEDDIARKQLSHLLDYFDTGILSIKSSEREIDTVFQDIPEKIMESLKTDMVNELSKESNSILIQHKKTLVEVKLREGSLYASEIVSDHGNPHDLFAFEDESDGTRRLFDLLPLFQHVLRGHVIIIDELDRSLHTKATVEFIRYFYAVASDCFAQLIATTHNANIMDLDFLRQDEIWFMERQKDHSSHLFSLNQFKLRAENEVEKNYLLGRYGAIPVFNQFSLLEDKEVDAKEGE